MRDILVEKSPKQLPPTLGAAMILRVLISPGKALSLYDAVPPDLMHDHAERNHQGLRDRSHREHVRRRARRGGLLSYYDRDAA
jgi:hypothetical protein